MDTLGHTDTNKQAKTHDTNKQAKTQKLRPGRTYFWTHEDIGDVIVVEEKKHLHLCAYV